MTHEKYTALPGITATAIKAGAKSMLNARYSMTHGREDTPSLELGRLVHMRVLEPKRYAESVAVYDGARRGKEYDAFLRDNESREIITQSMDDKLMAIAIALMSNKDANPYISNLVESERVVQWSGKCYGCAKCRIDGVGKDYCIELKTTADASLRAFENQCARLGYHLQLGWYSLGIESAGLPKEMRVITVETSPPYHVVVYRPDDYLVDLGAKKAVKIATEIRKCIESGEWPGLADGLRVLSLPTWMEPEIDMTE